MAKCDLCGSELSEFQARCVTATLVGLQAKADDLLAKAKWWHEQAERLLAERGAARAAKADGVALARLVEATLAGTAGPELHNGSCGPVRLDDAEALALLRAARAILAKVDGEVG